MKRSWGAALGAVLLTASLAQIVGSPASRAATATGWSIVESLGGGDHSTLQSVAAIASDDVWAVGYRPGASGNETLAAHRDGSGWSTIASPNPGTDGNEFQRGRRRRRHARLGGRDPDRHDGPSP